MTPGKLRESSRLQVCGQGTAPESESLPCRVHEFLFRKVLCEYETNETHSYNDCLCCSSHHGSQSTSDIAKGSLQVGPSLCLLSDAADSTSLGK